MQQVNSLFQQRPTLPHRGRRLRFQDQLHLVSDFIDRIQTHRTGHSAFGSHRIDGDRKRRNLAVNRRLFEQKSFPASGRFHLPVCQLGYLQFCGNRFGNPHEFRHPIEFIDEMRE